MRKLIHASMSDSAILISANDYRSVRLAVLTDGSPPPTAISLTVSEARRLAEALYVAANKGGTP